MTPSVEIVRLWTSKQHGTFGALKINKELFCWSLEPYNYWNLSRESCIPLGQYLCKRVKSQLVERITKGLLNETFELQNVPLRTDVRFHPGNTDSDTEGCQILGDKLGKLADDRAVLNSGETFKRFMAMLEDYDEILLTIREAY